MTRTAVAVVGVGRIGARHVQSLLSSRLRADVFAVEPSSAARAAAQAILAPQGDAARRLCWAADCSALPRRVDLAVVSTTAQVRLAALGALLSKCRPRHVILEKFLFPDEKAYGRASRLLEPLKGRAWVNCPRRYWPGYKALRRELAGRRFDLNVSGEAWGLASNAVHFLDLAAFLARESTAPSRVHGELVPVPGFRPGLRELYGSLRAELRGGSTLSLTCARGKKSSPSLLLCAHSFRMAVDEGAEQAARSEGRGWLPQPFPTLFQSRLSGLYLEDLRDEGRCSLPSFQSSADTHLALMKAFRTAFRMRGGSALPVT